MPRTKQQRPRHILGSPVGSDSELDNNAVMTSSDENEAASERSQVAERATGPEKNSEDQISPMPSFVTEENDRKISSPACLSPRPRSAADLTDIPDPVDSAVQAGQTEEKELDMNSQNTMYLSYLQKVISQTMQFQSDKSESEMDQNNSDDKSMNSKDSDNESKLDGDDLAKKAEIMRKMSNDPQFRSMWQNLMFNPLQLMVKMILSSQKGNKTGEENESYKTDSSTERGLDHSLPRSELDDIKERIKKDVDSSSEGISMPCLKTSDRLFKGHGADESSGNGGDKNLQKDEHRRHGDLENSTPKIIEKSSRMKEQLDNYQSQNPRTSPSNPPPERNKAQKSGGRSHYDYPLPYIPLPGMPNQFIPPSFPMLSGGAGRPPYIGNPKDVRPYFTENLHGFVEEHKKSHREASVASPHSPRERKIPSRNSHAVYEEEQDHKFPPNLDKKRVHPSWTPPHRRPGHPYQRDFFGVPSPKNLTNANSERPHPYQSINSAPTHLPLAIAPFRQYCGIPPPTYLNPWPLLYPPMQMDPLLPAPFPTSLPDSRGLSSNRCSESSASSISPRSRSPHSLLCPPSSQGKSRSKTSPTNPTESFHAAIVQRAKEMNKGMDPENMYIECPICHKRIKRLYHFQRHMRIHSGEKNHKCEYCQYKSVRKDNLKSHMKTHEKSKHENKRGVARRDSTGQINFSTSPGYQHHSIHDRNHLSPSMLVSPSNSLSPLPAGNLAPHIFPYGTASIGSRSLTPDSSYSNALFESSDSQKSRCNSLFDSNHAMNEHMIKSGMLFNNYSGIPPFVSVPPPLFPGKSASRNSPGRITEITNEERKDRRQESPLRESPEYSMHEIHKGGKVVEGNSRNIFKPISNSDGERSSPSGKVSYASSRKRSDHDDAKETETKKRLKLQETVDQGRRSSMSLDGHIRSNSNNSNNLDLTSNVSASNSPQNKCEGEDERKISSSSRDDVQERIVNRHESTSPSSKNDEVAKNGLRFPFFHGFSNPAPEWKFHLNGIRADRSDDRTSLATSTTIPGFLPIRHPEINKTSSEKQSEHDKSSQLARLSPGALSTGTSGSPEASDEVKSSFSYFEKETTKVADPGNQKPTETPNNISDETKLRYSPCPSSLPHATPLGCDSCSSTTARLTQPDTTTPCQDGTLDLKDKSTKALDDPVASKNTDFSVRYLVHPSYGQANRGFKCRLCEFTGPSNSSLQEHMNTHKEDGLYKCQQCDYHGKNLSKLIEHIRIHTGERPFQCDQCDYAAKRKDNLAQHKSVRHDKNRYKGPTRILKLSSLPDSTNVTFTGQNEANPEDVKFSQNRKSEYQTIPVPAVSHFSAISSDALQRQDPALATSFSPASWFGNKMIPGHPLNGFYGKSDTRMSNAEQKSDPRINALRSFNYGPQPILPYGNMASPLVFGHPLMTSSFMNAMPGLTVEDKSPREKGVGFFANFSSSPSNARPNRGNSVANEASFTKSLQQCAR